MTETPHPSPRQFDEEFRQSFRDLILWRRDVRRFRRDPIDAALMDSLLELASHAPSVGHCQPWRFVLVESPERREEVKSSFARANAKALENYYGEQRAH
jgi:5,6-dimethylbenzimidazole synthase